MTNSDNDSKFLEHLERIANALEKHSPTDPTPADLEPASAYVWNRARRRLTPVTKVNRVDLRLLCGIDYQREQCVIVGGTWDRKIIIGQSCAWHRY